MQQIFLLSEYVSRNDNSTGYYWNDIIRMLARNFGSLSVICPKQDNENCFEALGQVKFYFVRNEKFSNRKLLLRIFGQLLKAIRFCLYLLRYANKGDVVISGTNPALFVLLMPILRKVTPFSWLLVVHDVFPENLIPAKILSKNNISYLLLKKYSDWAYGSANTIVVIGRDMAGLINEKIGSSSRIKLIQNWVRPSDIAVLPKEKALIIRDLSWQKQIVFQFFGNMGRVQGIENILSAIERVKHPKASFLFIGNGVMTPVIKSFIKNNPRLSVAYSESPPIEDRERGLAACDVAIVTLARGMFGLGVPSKAYFSLAADRPLLVVSDFGSEIGKVVEEDKVGWWCKPDDPSALSSMIDHICSLDLTTYRGRPRRALVEKYSDDIALEKYNRAVSELLCG
ncbi:MAG: glycosyltransferase WbuB [Deltaproteobacteria bacterium]|nr:MAG: glycosyltransferase WbuB [Deltaproteobacteria bacterium]